MCLYVIIILLHDLTLLRCKTCAIDIGSLKATYLLTYLLTYLQRYKHVELVQFWACFRVAWVCRRQMGFLVYLSVHVRLKSFLPLRNCGLLGLLATCNHV